mgnify:CR=1 FL=1
MDFIAAFAALLAAYFLRAQEKILPDFLKQPDLGSFPAFSVYVKISVVASIVFVVLLALFRLYSLRVTDSLLQEIRKIFSASLIWLMAVITYYFALREFPFSRLVLFYAFSFMFLFASFGRILIKSIQRHLLKKGIGKRKIVFIGDNEISVEMSDFFERSLSASVIGIVKNFEELERLMNEKKSVEEVIQTRDNQVEAEKIVAFCREHQLQYHFVPDLLEMYRSNVEISAIGSFPLISLRPTPLEGWGRVLKRGCDLIFSSIGLIILAPFFLIITIVIKLNSKGTVFFRFLDDGKLAMRIGEHGRKFHCLKFRTMYEKTHQMRYCELADKNVRKDSPLVKIVDDPRVTGVGKFLRRFSIDELPQLWNVLKGEMSLVGPRPHLPEEVEKYQNHHKFVLTLKPGISGLAQISGRSDLPFEEEVRLDTYYIENWSLLLDFKIILKTIFVVLKPYKE